MAVKTYHGSCDCGKVAFEIPLDLAQGTFKCNCKICWKGRFWGASAKQEGLKMLSGEKEVLKYGSRIIHHFCRNCGIKLFGRMADGTKMAINLAVLDDATPEELMAAPLRYVNGRHDDWAGKPEFTAHL